MFLAFFFFTKVLLLVIFAARFLALAANDGLYLAEYSSSSTLLNVTKSGKSYRTSATAKVVESTKQNSNLVCSNNKLNGLSAL